MEKYCSKCGKELVDGKCTCNELSKDNIFTYIKEFITKPVDTTNKFIKNGTNEDSYIILLITSIVLGLISTTLFRRIFVPFKLVLLSTIIIYLFFLVFSAIINLISKYIIKEEISYEKILKLISISSVSFILVGIIYYLIYYLFNIVFIELLGFGVLLFSITFTFGINKISKMDLNKIPYLLIATILIITFIVNIIL